MCTFSPRNFFKIFICLLLNENAGLQIIQHASNAGGIFSGGYYIDSAGNFNPITAGVGISKVYYTLRDSLLFYQKRLISNKPKNSRVLSKPIINPITLGDKIRNRRIELGLFQSELAEIIGASEDTIRNWEKNRSDSSSRFKMKLLQFLELVI